MRIETKTVKGKELKPGDLFSVAPEEYWLDVNNRDTDPAPIGERVYIRTNAPAPTSDETVVTQVIIHQEEALITKEWDGKGAHPFEPPVPVEMIEEGHPCIHCGESEKLGNHQLEPEVPDASVN